MADDELDLYGLSANQAVGIMKKVIRGRVPSESNLSDEALSEVVEDMIKALAAGGIVVAKPLIADVRDFYPGQRRVVVAAPAEYLHGLQVNAPGL